MGQTLSEPITKKATSSAENDFLKVGSSCMQGWRINMEDSHTHILKLNDDPDASFFGVYDGHGGSKIAESISTNLHKYVLRHPEYAVGHYHKAIEEAFLLCDAEMREDSSLTDEASGSTAITALLRNRKKLYVSNVGDSRCVGFRGNETIALSVDHKPNDPLEHRRIDEAGGFVDFNRVNGNLALSRAFGDFEFKKNTELPPEKQIVTCFPEIVENDIDDSWNFIVLACDGIWDVLSNEEVVNFIAARIALNHQPEVVCEKLMNRCLSEDSSMGGFGCDNMTVIIVCFLHDQPYSRLVERCANYISKLNERTRDITEEEHEQGGGDWSRGGKTWDYDSDEELEKEDTSAESSLPSGVEEESPPGATLISDEKKTNKEDEPCEKGQCSKEEEATAAQENLPSSPTPVEASPPE